MNKFKMYRGSIEIDYYIYFTKAYFAFNAYLKEKYPKNTDIDKIKKIKEDKVLQQKFYNLMFKGDNFRKNLLNFKNSLHNTKIENNNKTISFFQVKIRDYKEEVIFDGLYYNIKYYIRILKEEKFIIKVKEVQKQCKYDNLEKTLEDMKLSKRQKNKIKEEIESYRSKYIVDLSKDFEKLQNIEELNIEEQKKLIERLYRGFIEVLYKLRNGLFHSEIEPNKEVMKVYKFAYFLLRELLYKIPTN